MIKLPKALTVKQKKEIQDLYFSFVESIDIRKFRSINRAIDKQTKSLRKSKLAWERELILYIEAMHNLTEDIIRDECVVCSFSESYIIAAVYYFVTMEDVIPDWHMNDGYLDDAYVVNLCLKKIDKRHLNKINQFVNNLKFRV